jgi:hypothetical protein
MHENARDGQPVASVSITGVVIYVLLYRLAPALR